MSSRASLRPDSSATLSASRQQLPRVGFRPTSRRRARIAAGTALAAVAVAGNVVVYSSLGDTTEVLQLASDVQPGELLTADDFQVVSVDVDASVPVVPASQLATVTNQYARVYIAAGSLMVANLVQPEPLVSAGTSVVAVEIRSTRVPSGLRQRSRVLLIAAAHSDGGAPLAVEGRVVSPGELDAGTSSAGDQLLALSIEVPVADAARVATADDVRVALLEPGVDPVSAGGD